MCRSGLRLWGIIAGLAFAVGYGNSGYAEVPPACPMFECKTVTEYWDGNKTVAYRILLDITFVPDKHGVTDIFTPATNDVLPTVATGPDILTWHYDTCTPWCGKDDAGVWQAWQEVYIDDKKATKIGVANKYAQVHCSKNNTGKAVEPVKAKNRNTGKNRPPLFKDEEGGEGPPPPP